MGKQFWVWVCLATLLVGCQTLTAPSTVQATWLWSYQAGDYIRGQPTVAGDTLYVGADDNNLHALQTDSGEAVWQYATADNVTSAVAFDDERVYFGSWDGAVYAVDRDGQLRWQYDTGGWVSAAPVLHGDVLLVASQDHSLYALQAEDGALLWRFATYGRIESAPVVTGKLVLFGSSDGYVQALDVDSGERQWYFYAGDAIVGSPASADGMVYAGTLGRQLYALDAATGRVRWRVTVEGAVQAAPVVAGGTVFVGDSAGQLYALQAADGSRVWQQSLDERVRSSPAVWREWVFVGTESGNLYAFAQHSGKQVWRYRLGGLIAAGPTVAGDRLYAGSTARQLQAFRLALVPSTTAPQAEPAQVSGSAAAHDGDVPEAIEEYGRLWAAAARLPDFDAVRTLHDVIAFRPQSPAAYEAHVILARYYAAQEAPDAEAAYRAALALDDTVALRRELAHYLETQGDLAAAYAEYRLILGRQPDAFADMRRTGTDPLSVAKDLLDATYTTDALETLRGVDDPAATPLRAQAYMALGRYADAATAYRQMLQADPNDADAVAGLALAQAWQGDGQAAIDLYSTVDSPDSRLAQAQLLETDEPERALTLYLESPYPQAWWSATAMLESQGRLTETLPIYERLATSESPYADDAAYRLYVLGQRLGDTEAADRGQTLLDGLGLNWLTVRGRDELTLPTMPPLALDKTLLDKVQALEAIGRPDLARRELTFAARMRHTPETDLAIAQALADRGDVIAAQSIAEQYIQAHKSASPAFWKLSYPRPYSDTVTAAGAAFGVDPLLIWAVMREESRFDPDALSYAGARGLMQVIPATQAWIAGELGEELSPGDAYVPAISIRLGAWLLNFLSDYFEGDLELAIPAYNAGAGAVENWQADPLVKNRDDLLRWMGYSETRLYLKRVGLSYQIYRALYAPD